MAAVALNRTSNLTTAADLASIRAAVDADRSHMLYRYSLGAIVMMAAAALLLSRMVDTPAIAHPLHLWRAAMLACLGLRLADIVLRARVRVSAPQGRREIVRFAAGTLACAALWASFPPLFFPALDANGRAAAAVLLAALAGGSATVLAPSLLLAGIYAMALQLPATLMFVLTPGRDNLFLGILGLACMPAVLVSTFVAHRSVCGAFRTSRLNERINRELARAQAALAEANGSLEQRVAERTLELAHEVQERQRYAEALARLASTDPLTGLANRASFGQRLEALLSRADATGDAVTVLFIDVDDFKQVNDVRGHATGDGLLVSVARLLSTCSPPGALISRWGGDEFLVAVPGLAAQPALELAATLRSSVLEAGFAEPLSPRVDMTVGIATYPADAHSADALIRAADVAMYEAKRDGKGRAKCFDPAMADHLAERHLLEADLRRALGRGELHLVYQPIIEASTERLLGFEALARWDHPDRGPIGPGTFIPIAEQSGQIADLGRWALGEACAAAASWSEPLSVAVNISVPYVLAGTLIEDVERALACAGLRPERLHLELTESMFLGEHARATAVFGELRRRGLTIHLDDFGTGYSSLAYLGQLPIDVIKIDRHFIATAERDQYATIRAILSIARALSMRVTAEGVETQSQRERLRAIGVDRLQGFLIGRPMPPAEARGLVQARLPQPA